MELGFDGLMSKTYDDGMFPGSPAVNGILSRLRISFERSFG